MECAPDKVRFSRHSNETRIGNHSTSREARYSRARCKLLVPIIKANSKSLCQELIVFLDCFETLFYRFAGFKYYGKIRVAFMVDCFLICKDGLSIFVIGISSNCSNLVRFDKILECANLSTFSFEIVRFYSNFKVKLQFQCILLNLIEVMYRSAVKACRQISAINSWKKNFLMNSQSRALSISIPFSRCSSSSKQKFSLEQIAPPNDAFMRRHIGPDAVEESEMLRTLNSQVN